MTLNLVYLTIILGCLLADGHTKRHTVKHGHFNHYQARDNDSDNLDEGKWNHNAPRDGYSDHNKVDGQSNANVPKDDQSNDRPEDGYSNNSISKYGQSNDREKGGLSNGNIPKYGQSNDNARDGDSSRQMDKDHSNANITSHNYTDKIKNTKNTTKHDTRNRVSHYTSYIKRRDSRELYDYNLKQGKTLKEKSEAINALIYKTKDTLRTGTANNSLNATQISSYKALLVKLIEEMNDIKHEMKTNSEKEAARPYKQIFQFHTLRNEYVEDLLREKVEGEMPRWKHHNRTENKDENGRGKVDTRDHNITENKGESGRGKVDTRDHNRTENKGESGRGKVDTRDHNRTENKGESGRGKVDTRDHNRTENKGESGIGKVDTRDHNRTENKGENGRGKVDTRDHNRTENKGENGRRKDDTREGLDHVKKHVKNELLNNEQEKQADEKLDYRYVPSNRKPSEFRTKHNTYKTHGQYGHVQSLNNNLREIEDQKIPEERNKDDSKNDFKKTRPHLFRFRHRFQSLRHTPKTPVGRHITRYNRHDRYLKIRQNAEKNAGTHRKMWYEEGKSHETSNKKKNGEIHQKNDNVLLNRKRKTICGTNDRHRKRINVENNIGQHKYEDFKKFDKVNIDTNDDHVSENNDIGDFNNKHETKTSNINSFDQTNPRGVFADYSDIRNKGKEDQETLEENVNEGKSQDINTHEEARGEDHAEHVNKETIDNDFEHHHISENENFPNVTKSNSENNLGNTDERYLLEEIDNKSKEDPGNDSSYDEIQPAYEDEIPPDTLENENERYAKSNQNERYGKNNQHERPRQHTRHTGRSNHTRGTGNEKPYAQSSNQGRKERNLGRKNYTIDTYQDDNKDIGETFDDIPPTFDDKPPTFDDKSPTFDDRPPSGNILNQMASLFHVKPVVAHLTNEAAIRYPCDPGTGIGLSILCLVSFVSILSLVLSITNFLLNDARAKNIFSFHSK
ncbi:hypothetical protein M8J75_010838 [Diaphorina citri]|nr:hypothetical protein M8J75_010838 [Diaphorina citri]